jgi:predicted pyridoxine 5'-phosphate oxidase superfamily flavin-nucleotide-binding protein
MLQRISDYIKAKEFISVATCDFKGRPNAAPKFVLKIQGNFLYLIDYTIGKTWENIRINPKVSLSFVEQNNLNCYQLNGSVEIIDGGGEYENIQDEVLNKQISLSTKRIIEGVLAGKSHGNYEVAIPEKFVVFKVRIEEIVEIGAKGEINREGLVP